MNFKSFVKDDSFGTASTPTDTDTDSLKEFKTLQSSSDIDRPIKPRRLRLNDITIATFRILTFVGSTNGL